MLSRHLVARGSVTLTCLKLALSNHHSWSSFLSNGLGCETSREPCAHVLDWADRGLMTIVRL